MTNITPEKIINFLQMDNNDFSPNIFNYENIILDRENNQIFSLVFPNNIRNSQWQIIFNRLKQVVLEKIFSFSELDLSPDNEKFLIKKLSHITNIENSNKKIYLEWIKGLLEEEKDKQLNWNKETNRNNKIMLLIKLYYCYIDQIEGKAIIKVRKNILDLIPNTNLVEVHHINSKEDTWWYYDCLPYNLICIDKTNHWYIHSNKIKLYIDFIKKNISYKVVDNDWNESDFIPIKKQPPSDFFEVLNPNYENYPYIK